MKIIELTCDNHGKHDVGILLNKQERIIIYEAVKDYAENNKRKTTAKKLFDYMHKFFPV